MYIGTRQKIKKLCQLAELKGNEQVMFLDLVNGKYYFNNTEIDLSKVSAKVLIINDIPRSADTDRKGETIESNG